MKSFVLKSIVERNQSVEHPKKDWNSNKGRSVVGTTLPQSLLNKN